MLSANKMNRDNIRSSILATSIAEIVTLPICTIKTNYQTNLNYKSGREVVKNIWHEYGLKGFYNASFVAILSQTISTSTKFTFYKYFGSLRQTKLNDIPNNILNGIASGSLSSIFVHPIDVWKIHWQTNDKLLPQLKNDGLRILYRGYSKSLTKNIILTSIIFPTYDFYFYYIQNVLWSSFLSSITATCILQPIDYLKIRHITGKSLYLENAGLLDNMKYYYRGFHLNLTRVVPHFVMTMVLIEWFKNNFFS
jgi:hypothetical protein